jgi:flagellar biosynthetic protein FliO
MEAIQPLAGVVLVLALLAAMLWWLKRRGLAAVLPRRNGPRRLESLERLALGPQHSVHLIRLGHQALIVACAPSGCVLLETVSWHELESGTGVVR